MKVILLLLLMGTAQAGELSLTQDEAMLQGFEPVKYKSVNSANYLISDETKNLAWPFEKPYHKGFIGNNFAQYQPYRPTPGYHSGTDMILENGSWMHAPVAGRLEAGHYAYTHHRNGSRTKQWKAWPQKGEDNYFEVAVIDSSGYRYELHHIDRRSLPHKIKACLDTNKCYVQAGEKLGQVVEWTYTPFHYTHVHLNVVSSSGEDLNPEHFFEILPDDISPVIQVSARLKNGRTVNVEDGVSIKSEIQYFTVTGYDQKNDNQFRQMPLYYELKFSNGKKTVWDFRKDFKRNGKFQDLREVFTGDKPRNYYPVNDIDFSVRLKIPTLSFQGSFEIIVKDAADNTSKISGSVTL